MLAVMLPTSRTIAHAEDAPAAGDNGAETKKAKKKSKKRKEGGDMGDMKKDDMDEK